MRYLHLRNASKKEQNKGGVTIAYNTIDGTVFFSFARCNPNDNFSRVLGRRISTARFNNSYLHLQKTGKFSKVFGKCECHEVEAIEACVIRCYEDLIK